MSSVRGGELERYACNELLKSKLKIRLLSNLYQSITFVNVML